MSTVVPLPQVEDVRLPSDVRTSSIAQRRKSRLAGAVSAVGPAVAFGRIGFALAWAGMYALHAICGAYLIAAGRVYALLPTIHVSSSLQLYQLTLDIAYFQTIANVHYALASIHVFFLVQPVVVAFITTCLSTKAHQRLKTSVRAVVPQSTSLTQTGRPVNVFNTAGALLVKLASRGYRVLLARDGLFGVYNEHFEIFFLAREVVETMLQTYQGYQMSKLLPRASLNGFYTLILVINCWTMPLLRRLCRDHKTLERLLVVLCDIVLDFVSSIAVPVVVAIGYIRQYDPVVTDFLPWTLYYDDVWLLNYMNEAPIVLFGSWVDAVSRLVFSLGLLSSMEDVKALITRRPQPRPAATTMREDHQTPRAEVPPTAAVIIPATAKTSPIKTTIVRWIHGILILWGFVIGVVYLEANVRTPATHCSLPLRPWLVSAPACAVVTINCQKHPLLTGAASDFETIFSTLDAASVEYFVFQHCPSVEMAPRLLTFRSLYGLKTFNSTIKRWNLDAALTSTAHPRVRFLFFERTHFPDGMLPPGLSHAEFPSTLLDFEIAVSNLQVLPETLPWPPSMMIVIEFSQLTEFPAVLFSLEPMAVSLAFNFIQNVTDAFVIRSLTTLSLRGNRLERLPDASHTVSTLRRSSIEGFQLLIEYTSVRSLPTWVGGMEIFAAQSPLCTQVLVIESSAERVELLVERPWLAKVAANCEYDPGPIGFYPLQVDTQVT